GRNASVLRELSKVMSFSDRTIDVVMASHPDADHIAGLIGVFNRYVVGAYFDPGVMHDTAEYKTLLEKVHEEGVTVTHARKGTKIYLDKEVYVDILFPDRDVSRVETNLGSIVLRVVYRETEILLTGDSPKSIEEYLVSRDGNALGSDILKVGHHGSKTSSAEDFVKAVNPEYAIISAGKDNSYGHPHKEVVELLKSRGIRTMSTGDMGTIVFESDGLSLVYKKR
ncbi:MAG: MBL fold metallo-hydrolase, partial [Candidatus Paceibacterota bacterium]